MPIGDLLASITGDASKASPVTSKSNSPAPKRRAEDELRGPPTKRPAPLPTGAARYNGNSPRPSPRLPDRPTGRPGLVSKPASSLSNATDKRPLSTASRSGSNLTSTNGNRPVAAKPAVNRPIRTDPPKKGSFQEIMARAQAAQEARKGFGKIQHKTIERGMTMKERKEMKAQESSRTIRKGATQSSQRPDRGAPVRNGTGPAANSRNGNGVGKAGAVGKGKKSAPPEAEKKVKKAALATTGYTGTARPRAQPATKSGSAARPSSDSREDDRPRYPAALASRRRYDDDDDDLDDFIEYDDEEDEPGYGRRGGYDSAEESDMEAGMSDIDEEERRADFHARREDKEQEQLEKKLKREKEERKRQYMRGGGR